MNYTDQLDRNENGLIFYHKVPKLLTLASSSFALIVWRNEIIDYSLKEKVPSTKLIAEKFHAENNSLIPSRVRDLIAKQIRRIGKQLGEWLNHLTHHHFRKYFKKDHETWTKYFDYLSWNTDYSINYSKTCHNLLQNYQLSNDEKFIRASIYCLEEQIEQLWIHCLPEVDEWKSPSMFHWLIRYWIDRMKNPTSERISNTFDTDKLMAEIPYNPWAIEYFWSSLSFDAQFRALSLIISFKNSTCLRSLLPKLDESLLLRILNHHDSRIMETLIGNVKCRPLAGPFWNYVKDIFDEHRFFILVRWMLLSEVGGLYCQILTKKELSLCEKIWISAPENLKEYVLNYFLVDNSAFMKARLAEGEPFRSIRLLKMVISDATPEQKSQMLKENWMKFFVHAKPSDVNELFELCLKDTNERNDFKRQVMMRLDVNENDARRYCISLLDMMKFSELDEFLKICSIDSDAFVDLKQRLVRLYFLNTYSGCSNKYFQNINEFSAFIDDCFQSAELSRRFKKEIMMARFCLDRMHNVYLFREDFATIKKLVKVFLPDEKDVKEWKEEFKLECQYFLSRGTFRQFDATKWQDLLMWCLGTEENVSEFRQSLNADDIFDVFLEGCDDKRQTRQNHIILERFLRWRFNSDDLAAFKSKISNANPDFNDIQRLLFGKRRRNDSTDSNSESDSGSESGSESGESQ